MRLTVRKRSGHCCELPPEVLGTIEVTSLRLHNVGGEGVTLDLEAGTLDIPLYHGVTLDYLKRPSVTGVWHVVAPGDIHSVRDTRNLY